MTPDTFFYLLVFFAFAVGAVIGSFLNVVIYRVPAGQSIVSPGSRCPKCETPIKWYDNIPILSWFILGGKCRECGAEFSPRYAMIEALTGFLAAALWIKVAGPHFKVVGGPGIPGMPPPVSDVAALPWFSLFVIFSFYLFFLALLVVITFVDLDHYLIPHEFTLPGMAVGVIAALVLNSGLMATGSLAGFWPPVTIASSLIGLLAGGLAVVAIFYLYFAARGIEGIGGGDVTMMALMGAWLGWPALIFIFFAASIQGLIAAALGALFGADFLKESDEIMAMDDPRDETAKGAKSTKEDGEVIEEEDEGTEEEEDEGTEEEDEITEEEDEGETSTIEVVEEGGDEQPPGALAVPFGPFIALAAVQYFFLGEFLPDWLSMAYLYYGP